MRVCECRTLVVAVLGLCLLYAPAALADDVPHLITVQGLLTQAGGDPLEDGSYGVAFSIYEVPDGGSPLWTETRTVTTEGGLFTIIIGESTAIPGSIFRMPDLWLGLRVEADPEMSPRQRLTSSPFGYHALHADTADYALAGVAAGGSSGWHQEAGTVTLEAESDNVGIGVVNPEYKLHVAGKIVSGVNNSAAGDLGTVGGGEIDSALGSYSTVGGGKNNAATQEATTVAGGRNNKATSERSTIGGGFQNATTSTEATVSGGQYNTASGAQSTVGGGLSNHAAGWQSTVGGGATDTASGDYATVGGGRTNRATAVHSTVGGGAENMAASNSATVAGGYSNWAQGHSSTVGGGVSNQAGGYYSCVPGGNGNSAGGYNSFACGQYANASHDGAFVWSDFSSVNLFGSTADNQFSARATGGVRFVTTFDGSTGVQVAAGGGSWSAISDRNLKENFTPVDESALLERLAALPISTWNYKSQAESIRHIGPMAQDFHAAFGVGEDDTHLTTIDVDGVALAAIQALYHQQQKLAAQTVELEQLQDELTQLRELVKQLLEQQQSGR